MNLLFRKERLHINETSEAASIVTKETRMSYLRRHQGASLSFTNC